MKKFIFSSALVILLVNATLPLCLAVDDTPPVTFKKIKLMVNDNGDFKQKSAEVTFSEDEFQIKVENGKDMTFPYDEIVAAEYSYSKNPRWKTGLGVGAAGLLVPPLWFVAIPLAFTKHRRHWLTVKTDDEFAVLKLSKYHRKMLIPTFETKTGVTVEAVGDDK